MTTKEQLQAALYEFKSAVGTTILSIEAAIEALEAPADVDLGDAVKWAEEWLPHYKRGLKNCEMYCTDETITEAHRRAVKSLETLIRAATAKPEVCEETKKATWIGQHVQRGFIAFNGELFSPEFYEVREKETNGVKVEG